MVEINCKLIKNFFSKEELNVYQKYCYNKIDEDGGTIDSQSFSPMWYKDSLMTALLDIKLSLVEKESNLKLFPTYAYWRYYVFGAYLKKHKDRPACEISITSCIKKYDNWPIIIKGTSFELNEGDAVLYAGCDQEHWRPGIYKGNGMAQVFLHYVNKDGLFTHHAYDKYHKTTGLKFSQEDIEFMKNKK